MPIVLRHKRKRSTEIIYLYVSYNKNDILNGYLLCIGRYIYVGVVSSMYVYLKWFILLFIFKNNVLFIYLRGENI